MRHFVLALMIALLPLRGWVGDAMAMEMAAADANAGNIVQAECPGHAALPLQDGDSPTPAHGESCSACQICHSVALTAMLAPMPSVSMPAAAPRTAAPLFTSAERAAGFKPPIS